MYPPENTPRAFHTEGMIKEFQNAGYEVDVIIPETNFEYKEKNIHTVRPYFRNKPKYSMNVQQKYDNNQKRSILSIIKSKVASFIYYFIWPDKTLPYSYFAYKKAKQLNKQYDVLFTITGPYSPFLAGYFLKKNNYAKKWIVDYGDPFSGLEHGDTRFYDAFLEKKLLSIADFVTIPTEIAKKSYLHLVNEDKIIILPQQFQWNPIKSDYKIDPSKINLLYAGKMYHKRPPDDLVTFLINNNSEDVVLHMFGDTDYFKEFFKDHTKNTPFKGQIIYNGFIDRALLLDIYTKMDYLINIEWPTSNQKPSKLIDYNISNRPIINLPQDVNVKVEKQEEFKEINLSYLNKNRKYAIDFINRLES